MSNYPIPIDETWEVVDSSKLVKFQTCERKFFYRYLLGWQPTAPNNDLVFGQAAHAAGEHLLNNGYDLNSLVSAGEIFLDIYRPQFPEDTDDLFGGKTPDGWMNAIAHYVNEYKKDFDKYEILYTEIAGTVPIDDKRKLHFRMDSVLKERSSQKKISRDLKTKNGNFTGKNGQVWADEKQLGIQNGTYTHALYCLYPPEEVKGMVFDGLGVWRTPKGREYKCDFMRTAAYKNKVQMQVWLWQVSTIYDRLEDELAYLSVCQDSDQVMEAFPLRTENCTKYFRTCPYHDFCCAWPNPLQKCFEPPMGYKVEFWDPRKMAEDATNKVELDWEGGKDEN